MLFTVVMVFNSRAILLVIKYLVSNICTTTFEIHKIICIDALSIGNWYIVQIKAQLTWVIEECAQLYMCILFIPPAKKRTVKCLANSLSFIHYVYYHWNTYVGNPVLMVMQ